MGSEKKQRVVIVGGGFAGLNLIKHLDKELFQVILVDRNNFHSFPPLFYQVASSGIEPASICFPFRQELRKRPHVRFHMGEMLSVDTDNNLLTTTSGVIEYDLLVLAMGTTSNFFGNDKLEDLVFTLKSTSESIALRNQILETLEKAAMCKNEEEKLSLLNFVVIGGGPTGVEVAGALGEMKKFILKKEYPEINKNQVNVHLIEGTDRLLRMMSEKSSEEAAKFLQQLEVDVMLEKLLSDYDGDVVTLRSGETIRSRTVIWTAGIVGEPICGLRPEVFAPNKRIYTNQCNKVTGYNDIFAIGDLSCITTPEQPHGHPQMAQVAIQQAENLARNLNQTKKFRSFFYNDKGSMATIGRNRAVVDLKHVHFTGLFAWAVWMFVHLLSMLGMKNKIFTFINWVWNYFSYNVSLRLLIRPLDRKKKAKAI